MKVISKTLKPKKFVVKEIRICLICGSNKISSNKFTIYCKDCGALNFYESLV